MFEPSAQKLIDTANEIILNDNEKVKSKYTIIIATAKRARQLVQDNDERIKNKNPLSVAIEEFENKEIRIVKEVKV